MFTHQPCRQLEELKLFIADLGLNAHDLDYAEGDQNGCW